MDTRRLSIIRDLGCRAVLLTGAVLVAMGSPSDGASSSDRRRLLMAAQDILENDSPRYLFGGNGERGRYDCSSFLVEAARRGGVGNLPRTSREQFNYLRDHGMVWTRDMRGWGRLMPGDIVFYSGTYSHREENPISHVMIYAGGGRVVGAQSSGVGYHKFSPTMPLGEPGRDGRGIRSKKTVYAYARPDWTRIRIAERMGVTAKRIASTSTVREEEHMVNSGRDQGGDWERVRWDGARGDIEDSGWESGWHFSGEARPVQRTIRPSAGSIGIASSSSSSASASSRGAGGSGEGDLGVMPGARGVWLP